MITLIGEDLAKIGLSFIFDGPAEACEKCRFKASCIDSLEKGRKYTITNVKDISQKCEVHDTGLVKAVEIEKSDIESFIDSKKAFVGSNITHKTPDCDITCVFRQDCFPNGLIEGDKCVIIENLGKHDGNCAKGFNLTKVRLRIHE
ncbi:MAG: UPF0179 family protein [Methanobrevibacter sp.]|nr:UPF0179 family protein [Methanobrevibacter sp.]